MVNEDLPLFSVLEKYTVEKAAAGTAVTSGRGARVEPNPVCLPFVVHPCVQVAVTIHIN